MHIYYHYIIQIILWFISLESRWIVKILTFPAVVQRAAFWGRERSLNLGSYSNSRGGEVGQTPVSKTSRLMSQAGRGGLPFICFPRSWSILQKSQFLSWADSYMVSVSPLNLLEASRKTLSVSYQYLQKRNFQPLFHWLTLLDFLIPTPEVNI